MKQFPFPPFKILPPFPHFFITQWSPSPSFAFCFCFCFCPPSPLLLTILKSPSSHWWRLWKGRSFVTKGGSVKAGRSIAVIIPFLITFRPINLRISSPRGTRRLLTLLGFGIIDLLLRRRLCFSLMDLVPPVGSSWGWRKLLLFLVMLAAKLVVSFFFCFLFLIICVGLKFWLNVSGGYGVATGGPLAWGLCYNKELSPDKLYCDEYYKLTYPCTPGVSYHGRGALPIYWYVALNSLHF